MISALVLVSLACAAGTPAQDIISPGPEPSRGILVNCSPDQRPWDAPLPGRPTLVVVHGINPFHPAYHFTLGQRLGEAAAHAYGPRFNVLAWNWNAGSIQSLIPARNRQFVLAQGRALADALLLAGVDPARTQLIGQSSGCLVVAAAARSLVDRTSRPLAQITLLDPGAHSHPLIFQSLAVSSTSPRVEHYWVDGPTGFSRPVPVRGVSNLQVPLPRRSLVGGLANPRHIDHLNAVRWYLSTVERPAPPGLGFANSILLAQH
jgi:hypothetical protein